MKIEFGCGNKPTEGYIHHDAWKHSEWVDKAFNLDVMPWPLEDGSLEELLALDVFEHLHCDVVVWLDECWRVLVPGGLLDMRLPAWNNPNGYSFCDPTHQRVFHQESFHYWCPTAPGTAWQNFGRYYFGPDYAKWWELESVVYENGDIRYKLRKCNGTQ